MGALFEILKTLKLFKNGFLNVKKDRRFFLSVI